MDLLSTSLVSQMQMRHNKSCKYYFVFKNELFSAKCGSERLKSGSLKMTLHWWSPRRSPLKKTMGKKRYKDLFLLVYILLKLTSTVKFN